MPPQRENRPLPRLIPGEMHGVLRDHSQGMPCILRGTPTCRGIHAPALSLQRPKGSRALLLGSRNSPPERDPGLQKIRQEIHQLPQTLSGPVTPGKAVRESFNNRYHRGCARG